MYSFIACWKYNKKLTQNHIYNEFAFFMRALTQCTRCVLTIPCTICTWSFHFNTPEGMYFRSVHALHFYCTRVQWRKMSFSRKPEISEFYLAFLSKDCFRKTSENILSVYTEDYYYVYSSSTSTTQRYKNRVSCAGNNAKVKFVMKLPCTWYTVYLHTTQYVIYVAYAGIRDLWTTTRI